METNKVHATSPRSETAPAAATITVVVPAYNCRTIIGRSLPPLIEMQRRAEIREVIVVDDGSTDGTAEAAAALGARVIPSGGRRGPAAARNVGADEAQGEILWFIDSDVVARSDAAGHIRRVLSTRDVAAVFGSYDDCPEARNFLSQYKNLVHHYYHQKIRSEASTFWAGCGAVWRDVFLKTGGFDARRYPRPSIEDIEFGYRLRAGGGRILLVHELQGTHLKAWRFLNLVTTDVRDRALPWAKLLLSRGHADDGLNVSLGERVRALIACLGAASILASLVGLVTWWLPVSFLLIAFLSNLELFALFRRRNGLLFALGGLLFHQFYYLYSTAAYFWCWVAEKTKNLAPPAGGRT